MLALRCPKVSLQSRLSRESCDAKFGMDECARNNYGVTLKVVQLFRFNARLSNLCNSTVP